MRIAVLGSLQVDEGRTTLSPRDRVILLALASRPGTEITIDSLAATLWGDELPETWQKVVQGCIVRLRKVLGPEAIQTAGHGYRLMLHQDEMDHVRFEDLVSRARRLLADGEPDRALFLTGQARRLWRGEPFDELRDWDPGRVESERLVELWRDTEDLQAESSLQAGRHEDVLAQAPRLVAEQPMRERRWGLLALAQYRAGRQAEALQTLHRAKQMLVNEFGLDPGPELALLEEAILRQDPELATTTPRVTQSPSSPYLGLVAYDVRDAGAFFGRETDIASGLDRLDEHRILAILGPSGSGKSSLARAGVAAALERDGRKVHVITPGSHPTEQLLGADLRHDDVLVVDQCEEVLQLDPSSPERIEFLDRVVAFTEGPDGLLVVAMRADRLGELSSHPQFARLVEKGLFLLGPMAEDDLRHAIEGPAAQAGLRLEPGLVDLLLREVSGEPAALPLLSHVLRQTWERREGNTLTVEGYIATGGVREAVAQTAEGVFRSLDTEAQGMLHDLMLRLVAPDELGEPVKTRVPRRSLTSDQPHAELVEQLVTARLIASDGDTVEIAHESLAVAWPRLRSWLDEDVDGLRIMRHLSVTAESWDELGRPDSELYRGTRQARAAEWHARSAPSLTSEERDFLTASADLAEREQRATEDQVRRERRLNQRLRLGLGAVAALLAVAIVAGAVAFTSARRADRQSVAADARRLGAEALRSDQLDQSLLLAAAGVTLDDSSDTRTNLLATLDRAPALIDSTRSAGRIFHLSVNTVTNQVAVMAADGVGLELYDGQTLDRLPVRDRLVGGSVVARPDGRGYAVTMSGDLVEAGAEPPILLLDPSGARSETQLGGIPALHHVLDLAFPRRWYLGYSSDSRWFAASLIPLQGETPTLTLVWDLRAPGRPVARLDLGMTGSAPTISADGRTVYSGTYTPNDLPHNGHLLVTDLATGKARRELTAADLGVRRVDDVLALSPDGRTLAVGAGVEVVLLDTTTLAPRAHLGVQDGVTALAFSPDGSRLAAGGDRLTVWDVTRADPLLVLEQEAEADDPAFSRDGTILYTKTVAGLVQAWDLAGERRFLRALPGEHLDWTGDSFGRISPDHTKVGYTRVGPALRIRDLTTGALAATVAPDMSQGRYNDIAWHPDSTRLNITSGDPVVRIWDSTTGRELTQRRLAPAPSTEGAAFAWFSPDGRHLLVGSTTGRLHVLDARTLVPTRDPIQVYEKQEGEPEPRALELFRPSGDNRTVWTRDAIVDHVDGTVRPLPELGFPVVDLAPSPDGRRLLVDTGPTGVGLLDVTSSEWISRPNPAQAGFMGGYFTTWSEDGALVASSMPEGGRLSHWDGRTGAFLGSVATKTSGDPAFSKDGARLLFAGDDGSVLSWDLEATSWRDAACRLAGRELTQEEWRTYLPDRPFTRTCTG